MQRLVYSPKVFAYIKSGNDITDVSEYIVSGRVSRKVGQASSAELTLRNWRRIFTSPIGEDGKVGKPRFSPMDPIKIYLQRVRGRPVLVFTGFLDTTPYYQMYPGTITLTASCTMKKLLYTYWDPALPYTGTFMSKRGWQNKGDGTLINNTTLGGKPFKGQEAELDDGSIGGLLFDTLQEVGDWGENNIFIEALPKDLPDFVRNTYLNFEEDNKAAVKEYEEFLTNIIGELSYGGAGGGGDGGDVGTSGNVKGQKKISEILCRVAKKYNVPFEMLVATIKIEVEYEPKHTHGDYYGWFQWSLGNCRYCPNNPTQKQADDLEFAASYFAKSAMGQDRSLRSSTKEGCRQWAMRIQGVNCGNNPRFCGSVWDQGWADGVAWKEKYCGGDEPARDTPAKASTAIPTAISSAKPAEKDRQFANPDKADTDTDTNRDSEDDKDKIYWPTKKGPISGKFAENRGDHLHAGIDIAVPNGTPCYAVKDGVVEGYTHPSGYQNYLVIKNDDGWLMGYGHLSSCSVRAGQKVKAGQVVARTGDAGSPGAFHLHFNVGKTGGAMQHPGNGNVDPEQYLKGAINSTSSGGSNAGGGGGGDPSGGLDLDGVLAVSKATAFVTQLEWPTIEETQLASGLQGQKSAMNDVPLMPFIQQLTEASMRQFQSLPDGSFFAFYPDYFGLMSHRQPYWQINDIEILDGHIDLSDDGLATHVYIVGDTLPGGGITTPEKLMSGGVVTIFNMFGNETAMTNPNAGGKKEDDDDKKDSEDEERIKENVNYFREKAPGGGINNYEDAVGFLQRYGLRPFYDDAPLIRNAYFEAFLAYQTFLKMWSRQFVTTFSFTFMPELFPGGQVAFPEHGLQMYIEEVDHVFDYESGFTTDASLSAPCVLRDAKTGQPMPNNLPPNMVMAMTDRSHATNPTPIPLTAGPQD